MTTPICVGCRRSAAIAAISFDAKSLDKEPATPSEIPAMGAASFLCAGEATLRLASSARFGHAFAVDRQIDETGSKERLVVAQSLGGEACWACGFDPFASR